MRTLMLVLAMLMLVACGAATVVEPTTVPPAPTIAPAAEPTAPPLDEQGQAVAAALGEELAEYLGISVEDLVLVDAQAVNWPDSALGCPEPDKAYTQVMIMGYRLVFSDGNRSYELHSGMAGGPALICTNGVPQFLREQPPAPATEPTPSPLTGMDNKMERMQDAARRRLAAELSLEPAAINLLLAERWTWADSSLGCPEPSAMYLQVLTPGYRFVFEADGQRYELHTDERSGVVRCPQVFDGPPPGVVENN